MRTDINRKSGMANEVKYHVSLSIVHEDIDPQIITSALTCLTPRIESQAGTERLLKDGQPATPPRKVLMSHWLADLHDEEMMYSGEISISEFLTSKLEILESHALLFQNLEERGSVSLLLDWFVEPSHHYSGTLEAELIQRLGKLGIDIEVSVFHL